MSRADKIAGADDVTRKRIRQFVLWISAGLTGLLLTTATIEVRGHAQDSFPLPAINPPGAKASPANAPAGQAPATKPAPQQAGTTADNTNTPDVAQQCAQLLQLATDLKAAVDKSSASTLSVTVVRKAGEIEQLAHKVRNANAKN